MDSKTIVIGVGVVLALGLAGVGLASLGKDGSEGESSTPTAPSMPVGTVHEVILQNDGFEPQEITIALGDVVKFSSVRPHPFWPASDQHPAHSDYSAFDPRRPLSMDEVWEFQFTQAGQWDYHDHLNSTLTGTVHVTE